MPVPQRPRPAHPCDRRRLAQPRRRVQDRPPRRRRARARARLRLGPYPPSAPPTARPQRAPDRRTGYDDRRPDYEARPARRPLRHWIAAAVALVALGGGTAAITGATTPPGTVQFTAGIDTGDTAPILSGLSGNAPRPTVGGVAAAIGPLFADPAFGGRVSGSIVDVLTGDPLYDVNGTTAMTPASAAKLLTAAAVLQTRGPSYRIATRAVAGSSPGEVVLVAGGDPTLAAGATMAYRGAARLDLLAEQVRKALGGTTPTRVTIDTSIYQGSTTGPGWADADVKGGIISNITALMTDGARINPSDTRSNAPRHAQPDVAAGQLFAQALGLPASAVISGDAPQGARVLGEVFSPTIARIVEVMLLESDNVVAEAMARQVALAKKLPGTFAGGAQATQAALTELGVQRRRVPRRRQWPLRRQPSHHQAAHRCSRPSGLIEVPAAARDHVWSARGRVLGHPDQPRPRFRCGQRAGEDRHLEPCQLPGRLCRGRGWAATDLRGGRRCHEQPRYGPRAPSTASPPA